MDNPTIKDALAGYFTDMQGDLQELQKAMLNIGSTSGAGAAGDLVVAEYDAGLQDKMVAKSPYLSYLNSKGLVTGAKSATVGYFTRETGATPSFIGETGSIPETTPGEYGVETASMKILITPMQISDLAQKGIDWMDLRQEEIQETMIKQAWLKDYQMTQGAATDYSSTAFAGNKNLFTTNTTNKSNAKITVADVRSACNTIIDTYGGDPTAILTCSAVADQLADELYPNVRQNDTMEFIPGYRAVAYHSPSGRDIPIIVSPNVPSTAASRELYIIDESTLKVRNLMAPTFVPLAKTDLSEKWVIAEFTTYYCKDQTRNARIYGIA